MALSTSLLAFVCLVAALLRTPGLLSLQPGTVDWFSVALVLVSLGLALYGACRRDCGERSRAPVRLLPILLTLLVGTEILLLLLHQPSVYRDPPERDIMLVVFRSGVIALGLLALTYVRIGGTLRAWRFPAMLTVFFGLGAWVIATETAEPYIDVWHLQQDACAQLKSGRDPYSAEYRNVYANDEFVGREILHNGKVQSFPYPPVSLLLAFPGYLLGDVRWSLLLAMAASAVLMVLMARRLGVPAGHPVELLPIIFLCLPTLGGGPEYRGLLMLEMSWTEPFVLLGLTASAWAIASGKPWTAVAALAVALGAKQYVFLCLPAWYGVQRLGVRRLLAGIMGAALVTLPFLIWDPTGLWNGLVRFHIYSPFRIDSLSVLAAVAVCTGKRLPAALGFVAAFGAGAFTLNRGDRSLSRLVLGTASIFLAFFVFNKAGHLNYYWLALGLLTSATLAAFAEQHHAVQQPATPEQAPATV